MPNPLIGSRAANVGKRADERPHAMTPRAESYVGDNHPYRGMHDHGVVQHSAPDGMLPDELWEDTTSGTYEPAKVPVEPVPVRIVSEYTRELRRGQPGRTQVGITGTRVIGQRNGRTSVLLRNDGASTIYIGDTESVSVSTGFPVFAGGTFVANAEIALYAIAAVDGIAVSTWDEYAVKE